MYKTERTKGFTLIEIAIVMIIIALLVGGIVLSRSMIRQAQVQSVIVDVATYTKAISQFQQKYNALPGDMPNATSFWGANSTASPLTSCSSYYTATTSNTSTCNGNGDGKIDGGFTNNNTGQYSNEQVVAWKHLSNAGMIAGNYSGLDAGAPGAINAGVDTPPSKVDGAGFGVMSTLSLWGPNGGGWVFPWTNVTHIIVFGSTNGTIDQGPLGPALTVAEAMNLDQKIDDGIPGTGKVKTPAGGGSGGPWAPNCATTNVATTAVYNTSQSGIACSLIFEIGF